jgi:hypothetical protein
MNEEVMCYVGPRRFILIQVESQNFSECGQCVAYASGKYDADLCGKLGDQCLDGGVWEERK